MIQAGIIGNMVIKTSNPQKIKYDILKFQF